MGITQTVEIPDNHRLTIDVPREVPAGRAILTFTPAPAAISDRKPISYYFGILSQEAYGDGVAYQRKLRDEWGD
ncbi:MAG: hypothetical protein FWB82_01800 [Treponema sp.]|nr:hypothetical protein [Treponema sp.]